MMQKVKAFGKKLLKQLLVFALIGGGVYAFVNIDFDKKPIETPLQFVQRVHDFYIDSGYDSKSKYDLDIEKLQEIKQEILDSLTYKQTLDYVAYQNKTSSKMIDNDLLNLTDETFKLANDGIARIPKPEYLTIDSKLGLQPVRDLSASDLLDQGLAIGTTEAKKSPVKQILK